MPNVSLECIKVCALEKYSSVYPLYLYHWCSFFLFSPPSLWKCWCPVVARSTGCRWLAPAEDLLGAAFSWLILGITEDWEVVSLRPVKTIRAPVQSSGGTREGLLGPLCPGWGTFPGDYAGRRRACVGNWVSADQLSLSGSSNHKPTCRGLNRRQ